MIEDFIKDKLGPHFIRPPIFSISECIKESTASEPIIFINSPGSDPIKELQKYVERENLKEFKKLSLGQGQEKQALSMFKKFSDDGVWLVYQNTHLFKSWMPQLEKLVEDMSKPEINPNFRLFLTTNENDYFPVSILQKGIKLSVEIISDVKSIMYTNYKNYSDDYFESCRTPEVFK